MFIDLDKNLKNCNETWTPDDALIKLWIERQDEWLSSGAPSVPLIPGDVREAIIRRAHRLRSESFVCLFAWWGRAIKRLFSTAVGLLARAGRTPNRKL